MKRRSILALGLLIISAGPLLSNELWVAPAAPTLFSNVGNWAVIRPGTVYFSFHVPDNLQSFTAARIVLIPRRTKTLTFNLYASGSVSQNMYNDFSVQQIGQSKAITVNLITEVDVSSIVQSVLDEEKDYVTLYFTGGTDVQVVGLRFSYVGPEGPTGPAGPKGDIPAHQWSLTSLRFQNPDGSWGDWAYLQGPRGEQGIQGIKGDKGDPGEPGPLNPYVIADDSVYTENTGLGYGVLGGNVSPGRANTAVGYEAMPQLQVEGQSWANTAVGYRALRANTSGRSNVALGAFTLQSNTNGEANTAVGLYAMNSNTEGQENVAVGLSALNHNLTGVHNVAIGNNSLGSSTGHENTALGWYAGAQYTEGFYNISIGAGAAAGAMPTGSANIHIGNKGEADDENTIRIGEDGWQYRTFIAGIYGKTTGEVGIPVVIDNNGQLATISSSARFKEDIRDMADASSRIFSLKPVTFRYKRDYSPNNRGLQYGLIAEEVAKIYPELVGYDKEGQVYTVLYNELSAMLLNEAQKQQRKIMDLTQELQKQADIIAQLEARLAALEGQKR